jgi:hypothetical protein
MNVGKFLKALSVPVLLILGFAVFILIATFVKSAINDQSDIPAAREAGRNLGLIFQGETLTSLSSTGGISMQMTPGNARKTMEEFLGEIINDSDGFVLSVGQNSNTASGESKFELADSESLISEIVRGSSEQTGVFAKVPYYQYEIALEHPRDFVSDAAEEFQFMSNTSQTLRNMYDSRMNWLTENFGMSANEVFDLARENKVNLFAYPENFLEIMVELGLDWTELDRQAAGVNFDSDYLNELSHDSSGYFDELTDGLGSFFNACTQC